MEKLNWKAYLALFLEKAYSRTKVTCQNCQSESKMSEGERESDFGYEKLSREEQNELGKLLERLDEKKGRWHNKKLIDILKKMYGDECHYCRIKESEIATIWGPIYPRHRGKEIFSTRKGLELEHKDGIKTNNSWKNLSLACPICNIAKSDQFTYNEFRKVGNVIREIWQERKNKLH